MNVLGALASAVPHGRAQSNLIETNAATDQHGILAMDFKESKTSLLLFHHLLVKHNHLRVK